VCGRSTGSLEVIVKFDIFGRFRIEVTRESGQWVGYKLEPGKRLKWSELAIPSALDPAEISGYLDDLYHESAQPGQTIREIE
jgi:hypothetical protein